MGDDRHPGAGAGLSAGPAGHAVQHDRRERAAGPDRRAAGRDPERNPCVGAAFVRSRVDVGPGDAGLPPPTYGEAARGASPIAPASQPVRAWRPRQAEPVVESYDDEPDYADQHYHDDEDMPPPATPPDMSRPDDPLGFRRRPGPVARTGFVAASAATAAEIRGPRVGGPDLPRIDWPYAEAVVVLLELSGRAILWPGDFTSSEIALQQAVLPRRQLQAPNSRQESRDVCQRGPDGIWSGLDLSPVLPLAGHEPPLAWQRATLAVRERISFVASSAALAEVSRARLVARYGDHPLDEADVVVSLGGDGLMLATARAVGPERCRFTA